MNDPHIGPATELLRTQFLSVCRIPANFGTFQKNFDVVVFGPRAGVVAVRGNKVLMIRQWRFLPQRFGWEVPGGRVDEGEDAWTSARRECLEETGFLCETHEPLITYFPGLDNVDNETSLFVSDKVRELKMFAPNPEEAVEVAWMPLAEVLQMIFLGEIQDAFTQIAILGYICREHLPTLTHGSAY